MKQASQRGGFAAQNSGSITDCYSLTRVDGGNAVCGGFVGSNSGSIARCFASGVIKGLNGGFVGARGGTFQSCYFFYDNKSGAAATKRLGDAPMGQSLAGLHAADVARLGFDASNVWVGGSAKTPPKFNADRWLYDITASRLYAQRDSMQTISISTIGELRRFAKRVNDGDAQACRAYVTLKKNLDLGGRVWEPIGLHRTRAFCGLFDGGGYTVKNFTISGKNSENLGFFGIVKGEVYNLSIDCRIKDGACTGAFAAQCEDGIIGCCSAVSEISGQGGLKGGFVGSNAGTMFQCYSAGRIRAKSLLLPFVIGNGALTAVIAALLLLPNAFTGISVYAPVPYDNDAVPIEVESEAVVEQRTDGNFVSFQFEQEIVVDRATGLCNFNFQNPGESNQNIVVQLQFTDAQAIRIMGSTGRTDAEQQRLESDPGYDAETNRMVLAQSGSIPPGYQLADLTLLEQANGATLPAGRYNAMIFMLFYDVNTNARAMLESQLPVVIDVR